MLPQPARVMPPRRAACSPFSPVFSSCFRLCFLRQGAAARADRQRHHAVSRPPRVPSNGSMEIVATVIEQGTATRRRRRTGHTAARHTGTGNDSDIDTPAPARRCRTAPSSPLRRRSGGSSRARHGPTNGQVRVRFLADGQSGTADDHRVLRRRVRKAREPQGRDRPAPNGSSSPRTRRRWPARAAAPGLGAGGGRQRRGPARRPGRRSRRRRVRSIRRPPPPTASGDCAHDADHERGSRPSQPTLAGKTATATVTHQPADRHQHHAADRHDLRRCADQLHRDRRQHGQHQQRHV